MALTLVGCHDSIYTQLTIITFVCLVMLVHRSLAACIAALVVWCCHLLGQFVAHIKDLTDCSDNAKGFSLQQNIYNHHINEQYFLYNLLFPVTQLLDDV